MSHDLPFYDIIICFDISSISVGHMICLYKPSDITYLVTYFDYVIFPVLVDHMTCGYVTGHVTFPTLHLVYIPAGVSAQFPFRLLTFISLAQGSYNHSKSFLIPPYEQFKNNKDGTQFIDYGTVTITKS